MEWTAAQHYEESMRLLEQSGYMTAEGSGDIRYGEYDQRRNLLVASAQTHAMLANHQLVQAALNQATEVVQQAQLVGAAEERARQLAAEAQARMNQAADAR